MSAADAHNFTPEKRNFMLFTRCTVSHLHTNNKHRVILHSVLSKMPITAVAHNKDTCSRHPTDGCYLRPAVITQHCSRCPNTALRCLQRSVTSCRQSCRRFGRSRYLYLQFRKGERLTIYQHCTQPADSCTVTQLHDMAPALVLSTANLTLKSPN